ncbi:MAG: ATP-dependent metallopeptidase FtsH/Yme1/Tma family protein, partial [Trinickia sp.]
MDRRKDLLGPFFMMAIGPLIMTALVILLTFGFIPTKPRTQEIAYSDFHTLLAARQIDDVVVTPSEITGHVRMPGGQALLPASEGAAIRSNGAPWRFWTNRVTDDRLIDALTAAGIRYRGEGDTTWGGALVTWAL